MGVPPELNFEMRRPRVVLRSYDCHGVRARWNGACRPARGPTSRRSITISLGRNLYTGLHHPYPAMFPSLTPYRKPGRSCNVRLDD
jgi:hypothetical protein